MNSYETPKVIENADTSEGIYMASGVNAGGDTADNTSSTDGGPGCDSQYMNGVWQAPDYSSWNGGTRGYRQQFGCLGCPAYTGNGCGLKSHYVESGYAASYDVDNGNRMPSWERKGYNPDDTVTDWAM